MTDETQLILDAIRYLRGAGSKPLADAAEIIHGRFLMETAKERHDSAMAAWLSDPEIKRDIVDIPYEDGKSGVHSSGVHVSYVRLPDAGEDRLAWPIVDGKWGR